MNQVTKDIMKLLNVNVEEALDVQRYIEENWLLDFSECSTRQFNKVVRAVPMMACNS